MRKIFLPLLIAVALPQMSMAYEKDKPEFEFSIPDELANKAPVLFDHLKADRKKASDEFAKLQEEQKDSDNANNLSSLTHWKIDQETKDILLLKSTYYEYNGGAHGMYWAGSLIWDKRTNKPVEFLDLFADKEAAKAAILPSFCAMLDAERLGIRGEPTDKEDVFGKCPDPFDGVAIFPTQFNDGAFLRIGFSLPPYAAGPYVEGQYDIEIAAPDYITKYLKPEYRDLFQTYM